MVRTAVACLYVVITGLSGGGAQRIESVNGMPHSALLNINTMSMWASDNGMTERNPADLTAGVTFPRGTSTIVHAGGIVWGGRVHDGFSPAVRVGGQTFNQGTSAGRIISPGIVENPDNADVRIYRIRHDWATGDLSQDASEILGIPSVDLRPADVDRLREMYRRDWLEWPWQKGAPYIERNGVPGYQPPSDGITDSTTDEPGLAGADQVIWFVTNDLSSSSALYGSPPIGLEVQVTCWAYEHIESLRNVIFQRHRLIYKGTAVTPPNAYVDSLYIAKWADPDVGNFSDDEVGYLTGRQVAYAYNSTPSDAEYDKFHLVPPVVGYDFLEGPRVVKPGATANWDLNPLAGYANAPASSFTYFTSINRPPALLSVPGATQWYNILRGYQPANPPRCMIDPTSNLCTNFELTGDPQLYEGWIDGLQEPPGDRRFALAAGPCTLAYGDSQEVVIALLAAIGKDNRQGISALETVDDAAQDAYKLNFRFPDAVPAPSVRVVELDNKLILDWESDTARIRQTELYSSRGYRFESYRIYQLPGPATPLSGATLYQAMDPSAPRYVYLTDDRLRNNHPLVNGQRYYFAVTTVTANPDAEFAERRIESAAVIHECVPHAPNPGTVYPYAIDETVSDAQNVVGYNDASVTATIFDPTRPNGHLYDVIFHRSTDPLRDIDEKPRWYLIDSFSRDTLINGLLADSPRQRIIGRGFYIRVQLPVHGLKKVIQSRYNDRPAEDPVFNVANPQGNYMVLAAGSSDIDTIQGVSFNDIDVELRFNGDSSWALFKGINVPASRWVRVPYTAWRVGLNGKDTVNRQVYTAISRAGLDSIWRPTVLLNRSYNGRTMRVFYPVSVITDSLNSNNIWYGQTYYDDVTTRPDRAYYKAYVFQQSSRSATKASLIEVYLADLDEDGVAAPPGTTIRFVRWKEVKDNDQKVFTPKAVASADHAAAQAAVSQVNVFPNPYYGFNRAELNRFDRFVTFSHLPKYATIRIFNLSGDIVKTIRKEDDSQFAEWDLNNENGLPAAGGVYLAHLSLEDVGHQKLGTKTLKLMIVPEQQSPQN